jgi:hypothetical protein
LDGARAWTPDLRWERRVFDDLLQRFYTDDGNGDGRLCKGVMAYSREFGVHEAKAEMYVQPIIAGVVAGRAEMHSLHERLMDRFTVEAEKPLYARDQSALDDDVDALKGKMGIRNSLVILCSPPDLRIARTFDETRTIVNGVVAGLASELYTRKHGKAPTAWSDLVPSLLPAAPIDPWTGKELVLKTGASATDRPLIYSVGADLIDDGGKLGEDGDPARVLLARQAKTTAPTWDFVVWPATSGNYVQPMGPAKPERPKKAVYGWGWVGSIMGK